MKDDVCWELLIPTGKDVETRADEGLERWALFIGSTIDHTLPGAVEVLTEDRARQSAFETELFNVAGRVKESGVLRRKDIKRGLRPAPDLVQTRSFQLHMLEDVLPATGG